MTGYGIAGPHLGDDTTLDPHDGWDADVDARADWLLGESDINRKGEA